MISTTCERAYPWAWRLVRDATQQELKLMRIKGSPEREKLKSKVMSYIVTQSEGYILDRNQERAADAILDEFERPKKTPAALICELSDTLKPLDISNCNAEFQLKLADKLLETDRDINDFTVGELLEIIDDVSRTFNKS